MFNFTHNIERHEPAAYVTHTADHAHTSVQMITFRCNPEYQQQFEQEYEQSFMAAWDQVNQPATFNFIHNHSIAQ